MGYDELIQKKEDDHKRAEKELSQDSSGFTRMPLNLSHYKDKSIRQVVIDTQKAIKSRKPDEFHNEFDDGKDW